MSENVIDGLEQEARRITERIPKFMSKDQAKTIANKLKAFMAERTLSQKKVADKLGVSHSMISQFLAGKYSGDLVELSNKIINYINSVNRKEKRNRNKDYVENTVAKKIQYLINVTDASSEGEGKIGLLIGDGGHGKSHCLRQYAEANKNSIYVELDDCMSATMMFAEIAKNLGVDSSGPMSTITRAIIEATVNRQMIIMLDEASSLSVSKLNKLRQIIAVKSRCPLILAGNGDLLKTIMQPNTRKGYECLDQLTSRLSLIIDLDKMASDPSGGLYTASDIRELYQFGGIKLTSDAVMSLRKICMTPRSGRLRTCSHIITALHTSNVVTESGQITRETIVAAIEQLDLPVKVRLPMVTINRVENEDEQMSAAAAG